MVEECFGRARYKFEKDDKVAFASRAAYAKYQSKDIKVPYLDEPRELHRNEFVVRSGTSECFDYVGKVVKVLPNGDVEVEFSRNAICIIEPDALVKMPFPVTGSLVRLVDDIRPDGNLQLIHMEFPYNSRTDVCGGMCIVLDDGCMNPNEIPVTLGKKFGFVSLLHLDFIARPLYMDFRRTLLICEFGDGESETWLKEVHEDLKNFLTQLPDVDISSIVANSPFAPGDIVKVISDVTKHISWQVQQYQMNVHGPLHQAFLEMWYDPEEHRLRSDRRLASALLAECLLKPGEVVQVNHNGDTIVMFSNGWVWCVRSSCLQLVDSSDACSEAAGRSVATNISRTVDNLICSTLSLQNVELHGECLRAACFSGNKALLEQMLLDSNMSLETEDENGNKPLHYAAQGNQPEILEFLIRCGANINATNKRSRTALHYAVQERLVKCVRELTKRQETLDINIQDDNGNSPFLVAAANGYPEIGNELVQLPNVDFTITNKCGLNALHIAAFKGHSWLVKMILSKENNLINSQQEELGYTALHFAVSRGHKDVVVALLTNESCAVDIPNKDEETPLLIAAEKGHWSIAAKLLLAGANVNKGDGHGDTVLHICLKKDLREKAQNWDMPSTCAMWAVDEKIPERWQVGIELRQVVACFLVRSGANIHCPNKAGITPLNIACNLKEPAVQLLELFSAERGNAESGTCNKCFKTAIAASDTTGERCLYCHDCGRRISSCGSCQKYIVRRTPTSAGLKSRDENCLPNLRVVPAKKFKEGPQIYRMARIPRGTCIIINNANFGEFQEPRDGSELDVDRMKALFTQLHFTVTIKSDLTAADGHVSFHPEEEDLELEECRGTQKREWALKQQEMKHLLREVSKAESQKDAECLVVILMSHGMEGVVYGIDGETLHLEPHVYEPFNNENCQLLQRKPKLFFVQACRGDEWDNGTDDVRETSDTQPPVKERRTAISSQARKRIVTWSDTYIACATIPNYVALKNKHEGSWFLSAVSEVFSEHACSKSLTKLMFEVQEKVMQRSAHDGSKQTPSITMYGWTKELYFNPGFEV